MTITYSRGANITDSRPQQLSASSFDEFCTAIMVDRCAGKDGAPYICGPMRDGQRDNAHAMPRCWIALDFDKGTPADFARLRAVMATYSALIYTTASHTDAAPRARVIIELSAPADPASVKATTAKLRATIGVQFDPSCDSPTQALFVPTHAALHWRCCGVPVVPSPGIVVAAAPVVPVAPAHPLACLMAQIDLERVCNELHALPSGNRNGTLSAIAHRMGRYIGAGRLERAAVVHAIEPIIATWKDAVHDRDTLLRQLDVGMREPLVLHVPAVTVPVGARADISGRIRNLAVLMPKVFKPVQWAIKDILPEGVSIIAGAPKSGKSFLVLQCCIAVATGTSLWGGRPSETRGRVLYIALEDKDQRMQKRTRKYIDDQNITNDQLSLFDYATEWSRAEAGVREIDDYLSAHAECRVVAIDTGSAFRNTDPGRKSAYAHDYELGEMFKPLCRKYSVAIVLVMHTRKQASSDPMDMVSGTQGMTGSVDNVLTLQKPNRATGENFAVLNVDGRDIEKPAELALARNPHTGFWACAGNVADVSRSNARAEVLAALGMLRVPSTDTEILAAIGGDLKLGTLRTRLTRMVADGDLYKNFHKQYSLPGDVDSLPDAPPVSAPVIAPVILPPAGRGR